jgi:cobalt/nickel transport system permease protein
MIPLMGIIAAFIFVAQMLNFPVLAGTSGHLLGGLLAAILLGPHGGAIILAVVLVVQCLVFQDGGITTLGANILNMSIVGSIGGYHVYKILRKIMPGRKGLYIGSALAAWLSIVIASAMCALQLAFSGISPLRIVLPAMVVVHIFIGIGEAIITTLIIKFVVTTRPDLIY